MSDTKEETWIFFEINKAQVTDKYLELPTTFSQNTTLGYYIFYHDCGFRIASIVSTILQNNKSGAYI